MILETLTYEKAVELATPIAKNIFITKILPIAKGKFSEYFKKKNVEKKFESNTVKYISRISGKCSTINTIAFQNSPKKLEDLYIPLTIASDDGQHEIIINDAAEIFENNNHILIHDTAGMGKSTLSKKIVTNILREQKYVPIFIELRQLETTSIDTQILSIFGIEDDFPMSVLKEFPLIYIFDGLDEIATDKKKELIENIKSFIEAAGSSKILMTSRQESFLSDFYNFSNYKIKPLTNEESFDLLKKYDASGLISEKLISGIKNGGNNLREFLSTPLYVSLLFCSYRHKTIIPQKKDVFYSQVFDALFESHDLSKEIGFVRPKYSGLDSTEFHSVLRRLGFWCLKNNGKLEFKRDELEIIVNGLLSKMSGISTSAQNFVKDLLTTVPLFVKEGPSIRWSHKSLMEYFSAMFICNDAKNKQEEILLRFFCSESAMSYMNVLELCSDIDYTGFRSSIAKKIFHDFIEYYDGNSNLHNHPKIEINLVNYRIGVLFNWECAFKIDSSTNIRSMKMITDEGERKPHLNFNFESIFGLTNYNKLIHLAVSAKKSKNILKMISQKQPKLFFQNSWNMENETDWAAEMGASSLKEDIVYKIDDKNNNKVNTKKNYEVVNKIISLNLDAILNINEARKEVISIEQDKSNGIDDLVIDI